MSRPTGIAVAAILLCSTLALAESRFEANVPVEQISAGGAHWFGYYDKHQFDPTDRYVLGMQVTFEDRSPTPDDAITLGMVDRQDNNKWIPLGTSHAWSWQQGCMLQWRPGSTSEIVYNDRRDGKFVTVVKDVFTGEERVIPAPNYALSADGKYGVGLDFARLDRTRPGYGYKGVEDPTLDDKTPKDSGIHRVNLDTGEVDVIISLATIAAIPWEANPKGSHWFNHLLFNTDGTRFIFLHRAKNNADESGGWVTRMFTADANGENLHCVADHNMVSHFIWKNPKQILAWSREPETGNKFHLYTDQTEEVEVIGEEVLKRDGHCTYSPNGEWILTDTYPDKNRMQSLMLYRPADKTLVPLGKFFLPREATGEIRCDTHPRWSRDGKTVCIDSMHTGDTRQLYLIDVSDVLAKHES